MDYLIDYSKKPKKTVAGQVAQNLGGFSLIELLAVIAVIAILSAILIPIVGSVRNSARTAKSLSNLRQLAVGIQIYSSDNKGFYPVGYFDDEPEDSNGQPILPPYGSNPPFTGERYWYQEIAPYIDQASNPESVGLSILVSPFVENNFGINPGETPGNYSVNGHICPDISIADDRVPAWNITGSPAEIILVGEGVTTANGTAMAVFENPADPWLPGSATFNAPNTAIGNTGESDDGALSYRANDYALVAFLDGHAEALRKGTVKNKNVIASP
jgi:prepilin-type N-terminal cleavage/methylation domain-containing protein